MPIRPENRSRYPKDWRLISNRIKRRARQRCECKGECGLNHYRVTAKSGGQLDTVERIARARPIRCQAVNGQPHPSTGSKVVLTVGHLNHQPEDNRPENLKAWCQRCHNKYDSAFRQAGIKERQRKAMAIGDLFDGQTL